jgi:hypothetical protein
MTKSRLLVGTLVAVFALAATTDVVSAKSARHAVRAANAKPTTFDSSPPSYCGKGNAPILHTMNGNLRWGCVTATGAPVKVSTGRHHSQHGKG